jgi:hypothetical protein
MYWNILTLASIPVAIYTQVLNFPADISASANRRHYGSAKSLAAFVAAECTRQSKNVCIVIHNIDGPNLRTPNAQVLYCKILTD